MIEYSIIQYNKKYQKKMVTTCFPEHIKNSSENDELDRLIVANSRHLPGVFVSFFICTSSSADLSDSSSTSRALFLQATGVKVAFASPFTATPDQNSSAS